MKPRSHSVVKGALFVVLAAMSAIASAQTKGAQTQPAGAADAPLVGIDGAPNFVYPQRRMMDGHSVLLHAPQVRSWPEFERFEAAVAIEFSPSDGSAVRYGTMSVSGTTEVNLPARLVTVRAPKVDQVVFSGTVPAAYTEAIKHAATRAALDVPLDFFLAHLADGVLETPAPPGFSTQAPPIYVHDTPTILLFVNGQPALQTLEKTTLQVLVNANWPTFTDAKGQSFYLLAGERWLTAKKLEGPWSVTTKLPPEFTKIAADGPNAAIRAAVPPKSTTQPVPTVLLTHTPAELIVTDGTAKLEEIPGTGGLSHVRNSASPLFRLGATWYFLASGRWFSTANLNAGPWTFVNDLPDAFRSIPADHRMAQVRASVPGTTEARMAALEAMLPAKNTVALNAAPPVQVSYAGTPKFEAIEGTPVARSVNTTYDVLQVQGKYYLCYAGVWYVGDAASGPWAVATAVPSAIYTIPPSSPSYHVTQVTVYQSTPTTVVYTYPPSYSTNVYVVAGVAMYGTGWYYPPYYAYGAYYPYSGTYGYGSWYNPATGGYGSRSVYYGPYGGASYNQAYNPSTGRYGYVETGWNSEEWASYGETYNPRTGVYTETARNYDEDSGKLSMDRTVQRGNQSVTTERTTDFDNRTQSVSRETSKGGSQQTQRQVEDGQLTGSSTIQGANGRSVQTEGQASGGKGTVGMTGSEGGSGTIETSRSAGEVTREGSFTTGDGDTVSSSTQRSGTSSASKIESSSGAQAASVSQGATRTTVAQSASGDLYAGQNGNVYKKTDEGWSNYQDGSWQSVDTPTRPQGAPQSAQTSTGTMQSSTREQGSMSTQARTNQASGSRDMSQLNRDYSARQTGSRQFASRGGLQGGRRPRGR